MRSSAILVKHIVAVEVGAVKVVSVMRSSAILVKQYTRFLCPTA